MQDSLITYEQLREVFGGSSTAEVVVRLESQDIPYKLGKRGCPITTFSAINHAMGISGNESPIIKEHTPTIEIG